MSRTSKAWRVCAQLALAAAIANCGSGPHRVPAANNVDLGVPKRGKDPSVFPPFPSGPACVEMWRAWNGRPDVPQWAIADYMDNSPLWDFNHPISVRDGVRYWTYSGNAKLESLPLSKRDEFQAKQITSIDRGFPALVLIDDGFQWVVVGGGKWTQGSTYRVWENVLVNYSEPYKSGTSQGGYKIRFTADEWLDVECFASGCNMVVDSPGIIADWYSVTGPVLPTVRLRATRDCFYCPPSY